MSVCQLLIYRLLAPNLPFLLYFKVLNPGLCNGSLLPAGQKGVLRGLQLWNKKQQLSVLHFCFLFTTGREKIEVTWRHSVPHGLLWSIYHLQASLRVLWGGPRVLHPSSVQCIVVDSHALQSEVIISALWRSFSKFLNSFLIHLLTIIEMVAIFCSCYLYYTFKFSFIPFTYLIIIIFSLFKILMWILSSLFFHFFQNRFYCSQNSGINCNKLLYIYKL